MSDNEFAGATAFTPLDKLEQMIKAARRAYEDAAVNEGGEQHGSQPAQYYNDQWRYTTTNELTLDKLGSYLQNITGSIIAVGTDQGLQLFAMSPQAERLHIRDIDDSANAVSYLHLESATRFRQLMGRDATPTELLGLYERHELVMSLLSLPPSEADRQHYFTYAELNTINVALSEIFQYLKDKADDPSFWMGGEHLPRIVDAYLAGAIDVAAGDISRPETTGSIREANEPVGLVYLSNIVSSGYFTGETLRTYIKRLHDTMGSLHVTPGTRFVQTVASVNVVNSDLPRPPKRNSDDWPYVLQDPASFGVYTTDENPNISLFRSGVVIHTVPEGITMTHLGGGVYEQLCQERPAVTA